jgi:hypothetical protein
VHGSDLTSSSSPSTSDWSSIIPSELYRRVLASLSEPLSSSSAPERMPSSRSSMFWELLVTYPSSLDEIENGGRGILDWGLLSVLCPGDSS